MSFFFLTTQRVQFGCSYIYGCGAICWSTVDLIDAIVQENGLFLAFLQLVNSSSANVGTLKARSPMLECELVQILWGL